MIVHSFGSDAQSKATELATKILAAASSPQQIVAACGAVEEFLQKHTPDQQRWFFSITFPTLICKIFGFDESSSAPKLQPPNGWVDLAILSGDSELAGKIFNLLSPSGVLLSSISAVDKLSLIKYVFPVERLPEWIRYMIQNKRDYGVLVDICPLLKNRITEDSLKGSRFQVQLNVFEYFLFWFVYYPVCRGNSEGLETARVQRSRKSRLENWASSLPGLYSSKQVKEQKNEGNLYIRLLYAYLRAFLPMRDLNAHQPYRSSLLHYSWGYDTSVLERAEFFISSLINFWLVDNDFSPVPLSMCKSLDINLPFRSLFDEMPPTSGLGEVINVFVKYVVLGSVASVEGHGKVELNGNPPREFFCSDDSIDLKDAALGKYPWNTWIQRPLYRFILRTFLFCPVQSSVKNVYQVFTVWVNYIEPWNISLQEFADLDAKMGRPSENTAGVSQSPYSPSWQNYVLTNYLYYSSLVMHFLGFAHKFLLTDPEVIIKMVSKVISILTLSPELVGLLKNMDSVYHSKHTGPSKSKINALHKFVPAIREKLQDWESGLCENNADGSFLHDNWNKDLRLFSEGDDGGQQLLQLFLLRAESELQSLSGDSLVQSSKCLDSLKAQIGSLFGGHILDITSRKSEERPSLQTRDEIFRPRSFANHIVADAKYKGEWMKRPTSDDEIAWLANILVYISSWLNEKLSLNQPSSSSSSSEGPIWSYVDLSRDAGNVTEPTDVMKMICSSLLSWFVALGNALVLLMRKHGVKVNLRILASKKVVVVLLFFATFNILRKAFS